ARISHELAERFRNAGVPLERPVSGRTPSTPLDEESEGRRLLTRQRIRFCQTSDHTRIAYATVGGGPAVIKTANWLSHLELDWDAPIWSPLFRRLARSHRFIRYDERGNGLSDWQVREISFDAFAADLESVIDAVDVERFALLGISQGASVAIDYAVRHPDRVSHLILFGAYDQGWRIDADPVTLEEREAVMTLTKTGWGRNDPTYRQIFSSTFMPSANPQELAWFNEFQRQTTSPENAARFLSAFGDIDVRSQLSRVNVPTLVLHSRGDRRIPFEVGRDIAARIPNAQFVGLDSDGHLLLGREAASNAFVEAVQAFLKT
ncbi:MAG: alpha/beta hydrolase, partial [Pseudomonadota bacterium]